MVTRYKDWAPTQFDAKGLGLPDRQDWIVAPVLVTRDTPRGIVTANYACILAECEAAGIDCEEHRFNRWGPGWFDIILVHPSGEALIAEIEARLEEYPILDEDLCIKHEIEEEDQTWEACYSCDFSILLRERFSGAPEWVCDWIDDMPESDLWELCRVGMERTNEYWTHDDSGAALDVKRIAAAIELDDLPQPPAIPIVPRGCEAHEIPAFGCDACCALRDAIKSYHGQEIS